MKLAGPEDQELTRRREQALFDRVAGEGGFAFLSIAATRWFSRQPIAISAPSRGVARYDVKQPAGLDDATRSDLSRDTKQALAYAEIGSRARRASPARRRRAARRARSGDAQGRRSLGRASAASATSASTRSAGSRCSARATARGCRFDALPTRARHLVAFGALTVRTLWAAYPDRDPRIAEGVVLDRRSDLHQDASRRAEAARRAARGACRRCSGSSPPTRRCWPPGWRPGEVLALRAGAEGRVELHAGPSATTH